MSNTKLCECEMFQSSSSKIEMTSNFIIPVK